LLDFLPDDAAPPIIDIIHGQLEHVLQHEARAGCMLLEFRLWDKLGPKLQAEFIEGLISFINALATSTSVEALNSILFQVFVPLMKRVPETVASGYKIAADLYRLLGVNHLIGDIIYAFLGRICRFTDPHQAEFIAIVMHDLADPEHQKSALEAALPLIKYQLIPDDQMLPILAALLETVPSDRDQLSIFRCLCTLLERDDRDALQFIAEKVDTFAQWMGSSDEDIRATVCEMLLSLVLHQPDLSRDLKKELIRAFPLNGCFKQSRKAAKLLIRIAQSDGAEAYAEDLFVALFNFFASNMLVRNTVCMVLPDDVVVLEDLLLQLANQLQVETVYPEFAEAVAHEAMKRTRVEAALENARQRALAHASNQ
jgi:hypothetical protein